MLVGDPPLPSSLSRPHATPAACSKLIDKKRLLEIEPSDGPVTRRVCSPTQTPVERLEPLSDNEAQFAAGPQYFDDDDGGRSQ